MSSKSSGTSAPAPATSAAEFVELPELAPLSPVGPALLSNHAGLLDSVKVSLAVMVGEVHTTLGELMALQQQTVLRVEREVDTPVDVLVNGSVVARGQLVVVDDHFGVRIVEIAQPGKA